MTIKDPELVGAVLTEENRATVVGYVCTPGTGKDVSACVAGTRLPDGQYRIKFLAPTDLALLGSQTHISAGLRTEAQIELPPFTDDLIIKFERIRSDERTIIPGTL